MAVPKEGHHGFLAGERQDFRPPLPFPPFFPPSSLVPLCLSCPTSFQRAEVVYPRERGQDGAEVGSFIHHLEASEPDFHQRPRAQPSVRRSRLGNPIRPVTASGLPSLPGSCPATRPFLSKAQARPRQALTLGRTPRGLTPSRCQINVEGCGKGDSIICSTSTPIHFKTFLTYLKQHPLSNS